MKYLKLFEFYTKRDKENAHNKRRDQKRYPLYPTLDVPEIDIEVDENVIKTIRVQWDKLKSYLDNDPALRDNFANQMEKENMPLELLDYDGQMLPIEFVKFLYKNMTKSNMDVSKPKDVKNKIGGKQRKTVGFKFNEKDI